MAEAERFFGCDVDLASQSLIHIKDSVFCFGTLRFPAPLEVLSFGSPARFICRSICSYFWLTIYRD
jgi:hypothetical protein